MGFYRWQQFAAALLAGLLLALVTGCAGSGESRSEAAQAFQAMMESRPTIMNPTNYEAIYPESGVDEPPAIVGGMDGFYERVLANRPPFSLRQGTTGGTVIVLVVSPEGDPTNVMIQESHYPAADESVRSAVLNSSYTPGRHNGETVPVAITLSATTAEYSAPE